MKGESDLSKIMWRDHKSAQGDVSDVRRARPESGGMGGFDSGDVDCL